MSRGGVALPEETQEFITDCELLHYTLYGFHFSEYNHTGLV